MKTPNNLLLPRLFVIAFEEFGGGIEVDDGIFTSLEMKFDSGFHKICFGFGEEKREQNFLFFLRCVRIFGEKKKREFLHFHKKFKK